MTSFDESVRRLLEKIPRGKLATYKGIAIALGRPKAARAVGNACRRNPFAPGVPCHRVVCLDGRTGGYVQGPVKKVRLLESEGIRVSAGKVVDLKRYLVKL